MARRKKGLHFYEKKKKISANVLKEIIWMTFSTFVVLLVAFVLVNNVGIKTNVIGVSMEPSLYNSQEILINRFIYKLSEPQRGDVIVFLPNGNKNTHYYIKRVVGIPGEKLQIIDGRLYVNGQVEEDESFDKMEEAGIATNEIVLGNNEYFVLGDNRNSSEDSRSGNVGAVNLENIIGKAWFHMSGGENTIGFVE